MSNGRVFLVGAGPGDPGLITIRGLQYLQQADMVVYDRLVNPELLRYAPEAAERLFMGKESDTPAEFQQTINNVLVDAAKSGKTVVRLKGGDPFLFGRGGEEAQALHKANIPFRVVPGITSAISAPAYAGIPVTHRGSASSVTIMSGSEDPTKEHSSLEWDVLASVPGTLVVLMGWHNLRKIVSALLKHGRSPDTPVAIIQWGTFPQQRTITANLTSIVERGEAAGFKSPIVTVIGPVVDLRETLHWFEDQPLFGKSVLITRSRNQVGILGERLAQHGAGIVELATINIEPLDDYSELDGALSEMNLYQWLILVSVNAVDAVFHRLFLQGKDGRHLAPVRIVAIGSATADALTKHGITADFCPSSYTTGAISKIFRHLPVRGATVLLPRSNIGVGGLPESLASHGARVHQVVAYRTVQPKYTPQHIKWLLDSHNVNIVSFTSSSTVRNLVSLLEGDLRLLRSLLVVSIGPATSQTARELGLHVDIEAREHTISGLVESLLAYYTKNSCGGRGDRRG